MAFAFHRTDHHRLRDLAAVPDREEALWKTEHFLAYLLAFVSAACAIIGVVTGFNKDGGHHWQPDGIPWLLASLGAALLSLIAVIGSPAFPMMRAVPWGHVLLQATLPCPDGHSDARMQRSSACRWERQCGNHRNGGRAANLPDG